MSQARVPLAVRLPAAQVQWLDRQAKILGGKAAVVRLLIDDAMERGWGVTVGARGRGDT
jgi:hypothetical protein